MQKNDQELNNFHYDEVHLRTLINFLFLRKFLILGLTFLFTLFALIYAYQIQPTYKVSSSFTFPKDQEIIKINQFNYLSETKETVLFKFISLLSSQAFQEKVFLDGGFLTLMNLEGKNRNNIKQSINNFTNSIDIKSPNNTKDLSMEIIFEPHRYSISMEGGDAQLITKYINDLVSEANTKTINNLNDTIKLNISSILDEISLARETALDFAKKKRLSKIIRINEEDSQKIRQINDQIYRARYKAKEERLRKIVVLIDSAKLAKSLGIIENNFNLIKGDKGSSDLTIAIVDNKDLPEWYVYGEKALIQQAELLQNRMNDDPYIPELVILNNRLNEVQNNNLLKTLEGRTDDSSFIDQIDQLDSEKNKIDSTIINLSNVSSVQIESLAIIPKNRIKPNKRKIVILTFFASLMISILLVLAISSLRPYKNTME